MFPSKRRGVFGFCIFRHFTLLFRLCKSGNRHAFVKNWKSFTKFRNGLAMSTNELSTNSIELLQTIATSVNGDFIVSRILLFVAAVGLGVLLFQCYKMGRSGR